MISIPGNFYQKIFNTDRKYAFYYWALKLIFKNPVVKFLKRRRPESIVFNNLLYRHVYDRYGIEINFLPSVKSANILLNNGKFSVVELLTYMDVMSKLVGSEFCIENEVVVEPLFLVSEDFKEVFEEIFERFSFVKRSDGLC